MLERLQKLIARAGLASRRASESMITEGRVRVNGQVVTELGAKADPHADKVEVDGRRLVSEVLQYVVMHKPRNVVSTLHDPEGRTTVAALLKRAGARLYPVGRLDFATSGALLATNDGEFANALLHPRGGVPKTYVLKVQGSMVEEDVELWRKGVRLEDGLTLPAAARIIRHEGGKTWLEVTLREGRNQQIRRMGEATGFPVMRLARMSFAGVTHEGLRPGEMRSLTRDELTEIKKQFGVPKKIPRPAPVNEPLARSDARVREVEARRPSGGDASKRARPAAGRGGGFEESTLERRTRGRDQRRAHAVAPAAPVKSGRSVRSETTPRAAATRGSRARGPSGR
ncbi:MAG TPA: pseudouridine synthase [Byssovorax sp.]|jgi:23S rRNA pseudouridine2605 synthase